MSSVDASQRESVRPPFVLPWYRFAELSRFPGAEQERVIDGACEDANVQFSVLAGWALTLLVLAFAGYALGERLAHYNPMVVVAGALILFVPLFLHRRAVIHCLVRARADAL
ncbi:MAG: hypothetical protein ING59_01280 [Burkholderiales bacterium]|jgi:hypothetical protein|nr:hypothetical protein [Burkholderiales bacterium]